MNFYVGDEIYGCNDTAGLKKLCEVQHNGLIKASAGIDDDAIKRPVIEDAEFIANLHLPKG